ncbi:hypothetical protein [Pseudomonas monsensis]|nr:hypothetical protein [Pseudomonas monsensis]MDZ3825874.1 hypothetical protein [Pseudomonas monsensis]
MFAEANDCRAAGVLGNLPQLLLVIDRPAELSRELIEDLYQQQAAVLYVV